MEKFFSWNFLSFIPPMFKLFFLGIPRNCIKLELSGTFLTLAHFKKTVFQLSLVLVHFCLVCWFIIVIIIYFFVCVCVKMPENIFPL